MTESEFSKLGSDALVEQFSEIAVAQDQALLRSELSEYNHLYKTMRLIEDELRRRAGDQRRALVALYEHKNAQVRLQAAGATLAVEPDAARGVMESIAASKTFPQAGHAGMTLDALERGIFKPT